MGIRARRHRRATPSAHGESRIASPVALHRGEARQLSERWLDLNQQLEESLARVKLLYDDAPIGYATLNHSGVVTEINQTGAVMLGNLPRSIVGKPLLVFVERANRRLFLRHLMRCRAGASPVTTDVPFRAPRGRAVWVEVVSKRTWLPDGQLAYHTILTDITERRQSEHALRDREKGYREIVETANEGICIVDNRDHITFVNQQFARMIGATPEALVGTSAETLHLAEDVDEVLGRFRRRQTGPSGVSEVRLRRVDGSILWTSVSTSQMVDDAGELAGLLRMFTDITDRKELETTRERLVRHMVAAQEAERRRVARELHDQMGQHLVGFSLGLKRLAQLGAASPDISQITRRLQELSDVMARDVHHLALALRPAALDDLGLAVAVSNYADDIAQRSGLEVDVHCETVERLDPAAETTIYRVVQEAVTNIVKHAEARRVSIILERHGQVLQTIVEDDGVGFDADRLLSLGSPQARLGLAGMIERAALIGGELQIESSPGRGTTLFLRVPVRPKEQEGHEETAIVAR